MTASTKPHRAADPLRIVEASLLGALFLGVVAMLSLPVATAGADWLPLWLVMTPAAALATSFALRLRRDRCQPHVVCRRRSAMAMPARRRGLHPRRAGRLLAAFVLR